MIYVILGIGLVILIIGIIGKKFGDADYSFFDFIGTTILIISFVAFLVLNSKYENIKIADDKITIYEENNTEIEKKMYSFILDYIQKNENNNIILDNNNSDNAMSVIATYPEFKEYVFISDHIEAHEKNDEEIMKLKLSKLNIGKYNWWLAKKDKIETSN